MRQIAVILCSAVLLCGSALRADPDPADRRVAEMLEQAKRTYGVTDPRDRCRRRDGQEIVVCVDRGEDLRMQTTGESDPNSLEARHQLNNGVPRAPDLEPHYPGVSVAGGCFIPPCPKGPIYDVHVKDLPEAPEGSDADLIAKGEMAPR